METYRVIRTKDGFIPQVLVRNKYGDGKKTDWFNLMIDKRYPPRTYFTKRERTIYGELGPALEAIRFDKDF